jgi:hypothetical protein
VEYAFSACDDKAVYKAHAELKRIGDFCDLQVEVIKERGRG